MDSTYLMQVLGKADIGQLRALADRIAESSRITVLKPAGNSLVMMGVKDSVQQVPFYLGEVLITQCAVVVDDQTGFGFAMGDDMERAYCLAVLEAALQGESEETRMIEEFFFRQAEAVRREHELEFAAVRQTKVKFDTMEEA